MAPAPSLDPQTFYTKGTQAELAKNYDEALRFYIKSAEGFLHLSRTAAGSRDTVASGSWKKEAGKALQRAERIKAIKGKEGGSSSGLKSVEVDYWSDEEQAYVLHKSSTMNDLHIPLWADPSDSSSQSLDFQPPLSAAQIAQEATWRNHPITTAGPPEPLNPEDIIQHVVSDCSVCAAVTVCVNKAKHERNEKINGIPDLITLESTLPNSQWINGRHDLKILFNGAWRRISVDSKLPLDPSGTILGMSNSTSDHKASVLWPSLVEKAYMKLMGGYDFPGSNSSIDFHALTGWIPEHIEVKSPTFSPQKTWMRILTGYAEGRCVLTLGTDKRVESNAEWTRERYGRKFLGEHNYAVVGVSEEGGEALLTILDSRIDEQVLGEDYKPKSEQLFILPWDDVCTIFEGVYLNWDPELFAHRLQFHGMWKARNAQDKELSMNRHLRLNTTNNDTVWILLTRHQVSTNRKSDYVALHVSDRDDKMDTSKIAATASYTNSTHVLVKTNTEDAGSISILASYDGPNEDVGFTVDVYSSTSVNWDKHIPRAPFTHKEEIALTSKNAGGSCIHPTYMLNPQYHLRLHTPAKGNSQHGSSMTKASVVFTVQGARDVPLNVTLVWSKGERIGGLAQKEIAASSGSYTYGFSRASGLLPEGDYTMILSAFEPRHTGPLTLRVESSYRFDLKAIPQEGAGMYSKIIRGSWDLRTAAGAPKFDRYVNNPIYNVEISSTTQLKIRLRLLQPNSSTALNVTLFHEAPDPNSRSLGKEVTTSGPYHDNISGVDTPQISLNAGKYLLVPSTFHPAIHMGFSLIIYCSKANVAVTLRQPAKS